MYSDRARPLPTSSTVSPRAYGAVQTACPRVDQNEDLAAEAALITAAAIERVRTSSDRCLVGADRGADMNSSDAQAGAHPCVAKLAQRHGLDHAAAEAVLNVVIRGLATLTAAYLVEIAYHVEGVLPRRHRVAAGLITEDAAMLLGHNVDVIPPRLPRLR